MATATWFEIPVADMDRAVAFYQAHLDIRMERLEIDSHPMALFPESGAGGISGALAMGDSYVPSRDGTRVYLRVGDVQQTLDRAVKLGGRVLYPATPVSDFIVGEFEDSEGNRVAVQALRQ